MNTHLRHLFITIFAALALPVGAFGANANLLFESDIRYVSPGETLRVPFSFNPGTERVYTLQLELNFPAYLLEFTGFIPSGTSGMMLLAQPPYDASDNQTGLVRKTIGFAGGLESPAVLGTMEFRVKGTGAGVIV